MSIVFVVDVERFLFDVLMFLFLAEVLGRGVELVIERFVGGWERERGLGS